MTFSVLIDSLDGWPSHSRVYENAGVYWIVVCPVSTMRERLVMARSQLEAAGIDTGGPLPEDSVVGPTAIFQAEVTRTPVMARVLDPDTPTGEPPENLTVEVSEDGAVRTFYVDGVRWGGNHLEQVGETYTVTPIDADGDPLNGLTPLHTLPAGTSFDDAIAFLEGGS
jgi:hypothetical protein